MAPWCMDEFLKLIDPVWKVLSKPLFELKGSSISVSTLIVGLFLFFMATRIARLAESWSQRLLKDVDIQKQLQQGNAAVTIFASTILIFVAVIVSFGLKG